MLAIAGMVLLLPLQTAEAKEAEKSASEISYVVDENSDYPLEVKVGSGGTVFDGEQKIRDATMIYELKIGTQKQFRIVADEGWEVAAITYERVQMQDSSSLLSEYRREGSITIQAETTQMYLTVRFEKWKTAECKRTREAPRSTTSHIAIYTNI